MSGINRALEPEVKRVAAWADHHNRGFIGSFYIRPFGPVQKGTVSEGHAHYIDHLMFVEAGSLRVDWSAPDGRSGSVIVDAPNFIPIKAEASHRIEALEDGTRWRCLFAEAEADALDAEERVPFHLGKP